MRGLTHRIFLALAAVVALTGLLSGCASPPVLPDLQGQAAVVMGFTSEEAKPYEGGTAYTTETQRRSAVARASVQVPDFRVFDASGAPQNLHGTSTVRLRSHEGQA